MLIPTVAEIVTGPNAIDLFDVIENVPAVWPAAIFTVEGIVTPEGVLARITTIPPVGAGPLSVTVPVEEPPGAIVEGLRLKLFIVGGPTAIVTVFEVVPFLAVKVTVF